MVSLKPVDLDLSVVIPIYNEGRHIKKSLNIIMNELDSLDLNYELIVVDDGSDDDTWSALAELGHIIPGFHAIRLSRNFGKEMALCAGLENAQGSAVIIMDADLQHPPSMIPQMVQIWKEGKAEIVECVKRSRGEESFINRLGANLFYGLLNKLSGYNLQGASDFKLLDRKVVQAWSSLSERNTFFRGMIAWVGFTSVQLEFDVQDRVDGHSNWSFYSLTKLAINAVVSFSSLPLQIVSVFGFLFLIASILLGLQTLYYKFAGIAIEGFTTVILLVLIVGSLMMISLGIIGKYIAAIYDEVKGRPRFLISQRIDNYEKNV